MNQPEKKRAVKKATNLLSQYEAPLIKELGPSAFELLSPRQTAQELALPVPRLTDLVRQGWLEAAPGQDVGNAHQYYRWRVEFVKRYRSPHRAKEIETEVSP